MSDDKKLTLGARPPLGIKKTVEAGRVRQSFSHGRTKSVVVEVKKRSILRRPGEEEGAAPPPPPPVEAPKPVQAKPQPAPQAPSRDDSLSSGEQSARRAAVEAALRRAEEDRQRQQEEQRRRQEQERLEQQQAEREARETKRRLEEERQEAQDAQGAAPAAAPAEAAPPPSAPVDPAPQRAQSPRPVANTEPQRPREAAGGAPKLTVAAPKPTLARPVRTKGDERRQSGKLTVLKALDEDEGYRARSLAALKRAREKQMRAMKSAGPSAKQVREVQVPEAITVQELANRMAERAVDLVRALMRMGMMVTINHTIDQDTAELLVQEFGHSIKRVSDADVELGLEGDDDIETELAARPPVVTIMGHVDHGKTSLLDALRGTDVVSGEAGGITQHIGAYQVVLKGGDKVTFIDTPGHAAFTSMRARGANVTDIVIIVVAADDGIMPQTIEAINHAKAAHAPMIVAINKVDKPGAQPDKVREALLQHDVQVEKFGGEIQDVEVSALKKTGLDDLLEKILLQAEILELRANPNRAAEATVIEAQLDKGRGPVATVLVKRGTLKVGDIFVAGQEWGKVRALVNERGQQVKEAGPSTPVEVLGLSGTPSAGDIVQAVESEARAREIAAYRAGLAQQKRSGKGPASLETMFSALRQSKAQEFPIVVKADVQGSAEAIANALEKLSTDEIKARVLHAGVGGITESDVVLAKASGAPIIGFNVRANAQARDAAERDGVALKYYDIIYDVVDDMKAAMAGQLGPELIEKVLGAALVRDVFQAGKSGKAAGCYVETGVIQRNGKARLMRDSVIVYQGKLSSLRRFKDDVNEVRSGLECGMTLDNFQDIKVGDYIEVFEVESRERTL
jgi:translation initiation factor IF-2